LESALRTKTSELNQTISSLQSRIRELSASSASRANELESALRTKTAELNQTISSLPSRVKELTSSAETHVNELESANGILRAEISKLNQTISLLQSRVRDLESEFGDRLPPENTAMRSKLDESQVEASMSRLENENAALKKENARIQAQAKKAIAQERRLRVRGTVESLSKVRDSVFQLQQLMMRFRADFDALQAQHFQIQAALLRRLQFERTGDRDLTIRYLREVLVQFFAKDPRAQEHMIPIMLTLAKCNEQQITASLQCWSARHGLLSRLRLL
jgi:chromosome segregation ATPase